MYHCLFFRHSTIKKLLDETSRSLTIVLVSILVSLLIASSAFSSGPLSISSANPRYFFDSTGTPIYLAGTYLPHQQIELGTQDFTAYLDYLQQQKHNFTRLWAWEQTPVSAKTPMAVLPYERTGRAQALDGGTKFDLRRLNQTYFDQLRARVIEAAQRGIYVSVVLFQTLESQSNTGQDNPWYANPFNRDNNINRIDGDTNADGIGAEAFTLTIPTITSLQEAYVRKVVDTLNDLDNVLYEISGDGRLGSYAWQSYIINYLKNYQATKANQHPVGIDAPAGTTDNVFNSPADWITFFGADLNPPLATGGKVLFVQLSSSLVDTSSGHQSIWKSFARGFNIIDKEPDSLTPGIAENLHAAIAQSLAYSQMVNFAAMTPSDLACSTGYCLLKPGAEYLVYLPSGGSVTVDLSAAQQNFSADWFDPATGQTRAGTSVSGGARVTLPSPFTGESILHLLLQAQSLNALTSTSLNSTTVTATTNTMSNITNLSPTSSTISVTDSKKIVSTPTITPNGGAFAGSISVSLATATSGATVFYTVDGSSPTQSSKKYSGPIMVASDALLKAKAFKNNVSPSSEASAWFSKTTGFDFTLTNSGSVSVLAGSSSSNKISATLSSGSSQAISFSVSGLPSGTTGSFSSGSCTPTCSTVLDIGTSGSTPTGNFSVTINAAAGGITRSTAFTLTVTAPIASTVATPTITPNGGSFTNSLSVTISTATSGASIYYTTDGSSPTQSSKPYAGPMTLTTSTMMKAKAFKSGYSPSAEANASFNQATTNPVSSDLVAYWKFDEGSGTTANDSSGNGNTGTLVNGPQWAAGITGKAVYFDGIDDNIVVADSNSLDLAGPYTLSAWVNPTATFTDFRSILVKNYNYYLYASVAGYCGDGSPLGGFSGTTNITVCQPPPLPVNTWTHLSLTYDGSTLTLYRNGVAVASSAASETLSPTTGTLQIGASQYGENFQGRIDEVQIYRRALTATDIKALYQQVAVNLPFNYSIANSGNISVLAGSSITNSISANLSGGSTQAVSFSASGLPSGATASFSSTSCSPSCSTVLNVATSGSTPTGNFSITISATGGGVTKTSTFMLTVTAPSTTSKIGGATYYVSPNGSGTTCSSASPCALSRITTPGVAKPGDVWRLQDGTYNVGISINCSAGVIANGTSTAPITVTADHERRAFFNTNGDLGIEVIGCSYWVFDGLHIRQGDNASKAKDAVAILNNSTHITIRRNIIRETNRLGLATGWSAILVYGGSNTNLIEENEIYSCWANCVNLHGSHDDEVRRNYCNNASNWDAGLGNPAACFVIYPGSNQLIENNICESVDACLDIEPSSDSRGNKLLGNIAFNVKRNVIADRETGTYAIDTIIKDDILLVGPGSWYNTWGFGNTRNTQVTNATWINWNAGSSPNAGSNFWGDGNASFAITNALIKDYVATSGTMVSGHSTWSMNYTRAYNNQSNVSPDDWHVTNLQTTAPTNLNGCVVFVPATSNLRGAGLSGADIGANVLYAYEAGTLTTKPLWSGSTKKWQFAGAIVSGANDVVGLANIETRLHPNCNSWPY